MVRRLTAFVSSVRNSPVALVARACRRRVLAPVHLNLMSGIQSVAWKQEILDQLDLTLA